MTRNSDVIHNIVPTMFGFMLAPLIAVGVGIYLANRYGGDSQPRRQAIAVGTILLAVVLVGAWGVIRSNWGR
jgi:hypothetical protein